MSSGDSNLVTVSVAVIGAAGTAFSAWLYSRHGERNARPPQGGPENSVHHSRIKEGVVLDIPPDPMDLETFNQLVRRLRSLERWRRHVVPILRKLANVLEWDDDEIFSAVSAPDEEDW